MQVSMIVHSTQIGGVRLGLVAFEFGKVLDPHEMLQDETRHRTLEWAPERMLWIDTDLSVILMDRHRGLLGRRGYLWADSAQLTLLEDGRGRPVPWTPKQVMNPATLVWAARRVPSVHYRVPAAANLTAGSVLHEAVQQAVLLQGAFRALDLHKSPPGVKPLG